MDSVMSSDKSQETRDHQRIDTNTTKHQTALRQMAALHPNVVHDPTYALALQQSAHFDPIANG